MPIYKSSEFKGFGFNYDQSQQPFFKALVKENTSAAQYIAYWKADSLGNTQGQAGQAVQLS